MDLIVDEFETLKQQFPILKTAEITVSGRMLKLAGKANYRPPEIIIAKWLIDYGPEEEIIETVRHEAAHIIAGPWTGHGKEWKKVAKDLGAVPKAYYSGALAELNTKVTTKWQRRCLNCDLTWNYTRRIREGYVCPKCKETVLVINLQ